MSLSEYIEANASRIMECWKERVIERLAITLEDSELLNDLPDFLEDVVSALRQEGRTWPRVDSAQSHGRHRMRSGTDMGSLVEEMTLIVEAIVELARTDERELSSDEVICLGRAVARGAAASANAYTAIRDQELARLANEHFSFVAHELRTPLQTAQLAADVLAQSPSDKHAKPLQRLQRSIAKVIDLVDNSLIKVRLSGKPDVHFEKLEAEDMIQTVRAELQGHLDDKELQLSVEAEDLHFEADAKLVGSALTNLLRNAVKFTPPGSRLQIRACERADRAVFEVEDECGGMPEDVPGRLFQPFVQTNADKTGHGLGLMIVKQAAEAHGGSVHVNNRPPHGCVFVMKLPLRQARQPDAHDKQPQGEGGADG